MEADPWPVNAKRACGMSVIGLLFVSRTVTVMTDALTPSASRVNGVAETLEFVPLTTT